MRQAVCLYRFFQTRILGQPDIGHRTNSLTKQMPQISPWCAAIVPTSFVTEYKEPNERECPSNALHRVMDWVLSHKDGLQLALELQTHLNILLLSSHYIIYNRISTLSIIIYCVHL